MQWIKGDQDLINQIQQKNITAFESLYKKYYKKLYILSFQYVLNHEVAEEIVHDVFINIWKMSGQIAIEQSLEKYLSRSVINRSLNHIKNENKIKTRQKQYLKGQTEFEESVSAEEIETLLMRLEDALNALPPQCKKVMMLSRFERLKQKKIAEEMGISIKTVKNHLTYGFDKMRALLKNNTSMLIIVLMTIIRSYAYS
jgi:RNA polymerase sigma-70 factor (family 1)